MEWILERKRSNSELSKRSERGRGLSAEKCERLLFSNRRNDDLSFVNCGCWANHRDRLLIDQQRRRRRRELFASFRPVTEHHGRDTRQTPELDLHFLQSTESGSTTRRTTTEIPTANRQSRVSLFQPWDRRLTGIFAFRDDPNAFGNIMYDRRVIRGNTYALHTLPAVSLLPSCG